MSKNFKTFVGVVSSLIPFLLLAMVSFGYFEYGGLHGAFGMIVYLTTMSLAALVGLIPVVGFFIANHVMMTIVQPWVFTYTGIGTSWLTTVVSGYCNIAALIICLLSTIVFALFCVGFVKGCKNGGRKPPKEHVTAKDLERDAGITDV